MTKWDGNLGNTKAAKGGGSAKPIDKCPYHYPYMEFQKIGRSGDIKWSTHGDESKGDPGSAYGEESHTGTGTRVNEEGHIERRNHNGEFNYSLGPSFNTNNSNQTNTVFGDKNTRCGDQQTTRSMGSGGGNPIDNQGPPPSGSNRDTTDSVHARSSGGDATGGVTGGTYSIAGREINMKCGGSLTAHAAKGSVSIGAKTNFAATSETGCAVIAGQGLTLSGAKQASIGTKGSMSLYSAKNIIWAPGGVYINCFQGPTNAETIEMTGQQAPGHVPGVPLRRQV